MSESQVAQIELTMDEAKSQIGLAEALDKLHKNRDFKKVFLDGYFKDEAIRLVELKGYPSTQREDMQADIVKQIDAIGCVRGFFSKIYQEAMNAQSAIEAAEQELEEIRSEEA